MPLKNFFDLPRFLTVAPPLSEFDDELAWLLTPIIPFKPIYMEDPLKGYTEDDIERIIKDLFKQSITLKDREILTQELEKDPEKLMDKMKMSPKKISILIEFNPLFACKILMDVLKSDQSTDYLSEMVNMKMSINSLEVVNRLTTSIELPSEFLHLYICNCINACEKMTDNFFQKRSVRILCLFLQSLIRQKKIDFKEYSIEVESFCITFSKIKEATELYKLCKTA